MTERFKIEWSSLAAYDLESIVDYIVAADEVGAARGVYESIMRKIESLTSNPRRCRIVPELREIGMTEFREIIAAPYRIFFRLRENRVVLVGILDGRRDLESALIERTLDML
jgi:toxin ParE1/3/4